MEKEKVAKAGNIAFGLTFFVCAAVIVIQLVVTGDLPVVAGKTVVLLAGGMAYAEVVVVGGRGVLEGENFGLLEKFAEKVGGAIGGTRPMVDSGMIPFNHQIGQTGLIIRPKICISFGVSGAIQHTEGIKDTKLFVAVNTDEEAAIYGAADYGMAADLKDVLECYLKL